VLVEGTSGRATADAGEAAEEEEIMEAVVKVAVAKNDLNIVKTGHVQMNIRITLKR
jgi:CO dehydrogenase/acetyl-CoA synthase epsilon subunit